MKVKSAILTEMSGKIGGAVASRARGDIQYFRKLVTPTNPSTGLQKASRNAVASASSYWKSTLTDVQREAWWDLATGAQTGQTLFNKVNQPRIFANNSTLLVGTDGATPPITTIVPPPASLSTPFSGFIAVIDDSANTLTISGLNVLDPYQSDTSDTTPSVVYVYCSHQQTASRFSRQHAYRLVYADAIGGPVAALAAINLAALGMTTAVGEIMYVKLVVQAPDGAISVPTEARITIVA